MKVYLGAASANIVENIDNLRFIRNELLVQNHEITRDWLEEGYKYVLSGRKKPQKDWKFIYEKVVEAIAKADIVIIEATISSLSMGYQMALATQYKKPLLILLLNDSSLHDHFGSGINSELIQTKIYTKKTVKKIIKSFVKDYSLSGKLTRANFLIDQKTENFLKWEADRTKKSKSAVLRKIISNHITCNST